MLLIIILYLNFLFQYYQYLAIVLSLFVAKYSRDIIAISHSLLKAREFYDRPDATPFVCPPEGFQELHKCCVEARGQRASRCTRLVGRRSGRCVPRGHAKNIHCHVADITPCRRVRTFTRSYIHFDQWFVQRSSSELCLITELPRLLRIIKGYRFSFN